ncbi:peptide MFS transporter [Actinoplanes solisilvae]|uniref:peptide MFS transporter n=1 Tax=Actinoplanes solisilvae TaxID=2486853 RepID=UPI000FDA3A79|nr:oligopeptide:H+ symporter [Actinoplanes solisilvae]
MSATDEHLRPPESPADRRFLGQPRPLATLVSLEVWERFSFYGMLGILLLYLYYPAGRGGLGFDEATAAGVVGAYGGSVYLCTVAGAWLADRVFGAERVLFGSAVVVMGGHLALALLPGVTGVAAGLSLVALGAGGVKATASALVGSLYAADDGRRDAGFSLFYLGINLGGLTGALLTGLLQKESGFRWGFGLAAAGMAIGLIGYARGRRRFTGAARAVTGSLTALLLGAATVALIIVVLARTGVIAAGRLSAIVVTLSILAAVTYFAVILSSPRVGRAERRRVLAFLPLFVASAAFCALYQQQFTVVTIYSDRRLDRTVFGWEMPVSWVLVLNPIFVVLLAGLFAALWTRLGPRQPSTPVKFALGTITMGVAFLLFLPFAGVGPGGVPLLAVAGIMLVFTVAELLIQPVGLAASTRLAPAAFRSQMVALFFLSVALGTATSGLLARYYSERHEVAYFGSLGLLAVALGGLLWAASPWIRRLSDVR